MEEKPKKPLKLGSLLMVFITISVIFSILAYGYGQANMAVAMTKWCNDNYDAIALEHGYSLMKTPEEFINTDSIIKINLTGSVK